MLAISRQGKEVRDALDRQKLLQELLTEVEGGVPLRRNGSLNWSDASSPFDGHHHEKQTGLLLPFILE